MKRIIDIHSHILANVDDGCVTRYDTLRTLEEYERLGVEAVICTPHFGPYGDTEADVEGEFKWLASIDSTVSFYLGNEVYMNNHALKAIRAGEARTLAGSNSILIEFDSSALGMSLPFINASRPFSTHEVILAHPERYELLQAYPAICDKLAKYVKLQINAYDIYDTDNDLAKNVSRYLLEKQLASYIGSDTHGRRRPPKLKTGVQWIYDHCPKEYADAVVHDNAAKIIRQGN